MLAQLGGHDATQPRHHRAAGAVDAIRANPLADVELPADDRDPFALLEKQLRESEDRSAREDPEVLEQLQRDQHVMADLEDWLAAIVNDRHNQASA